MKIGILKDYNQAEVDKAKKTGKTLHAGIEIYSLYDQINIWEIKHNHDPAGVLSELKLELMQALGKLEVKDGGEQ